MSDLVTFTSKLPFLDPKFGHLYYSTQGNRPADFILLTMALVQQSRLGAFVVVRG